MTPIETPKPESFRGQREFALEAALKLPTRSAVNRIGLESFNDLVSRDLAATVHVVATEVPGGWAQVTVPNWLWGRRPLELFRKANYQTRRLPNGDLAVRPLEGYRRTRPDLLELVSVAGPGVDRERWDYLATMGVDEVEEVARASAARHVEGLKTDTSNLLEMVRFYQVAAAAIPMAGLPEQSKVIQESILQVRIEGGEAAFPNAGVFAIRRSDALLHRVKLVSVLLRVHHDTQLFGGDLSGIRAAQGHEEQVFAASSSLQMGLYLLDQYVGPLLGALTPAVWGFATHRGYGPVIYSFGRQVAGAEGNAPELLRTLPLRGADRITEFADLTPLAVPSALSWWADHLNQVLAVITDPSVFADGAGNYRPVLQLQAILTLEQVFSRVLSLQAAHHDLNARRVLLFTLLDSVESLTGRPIERNCDHSFASRTLTRLGAGIPPAAQELLLARAHAGVEALRRVQDGFYMREPNGNILLRPSTGQAVSAQRAAAEYLKLLRNATHGHSTVRASAAEPTESLLVRHNGEVPHEIGLLGWLYLVDLLSRPDALRRHLAAQSRRVA